MNLLPKWILTNGLPAFKDGESATVLEQTYRIYQAMQTLIDDYNQFVDDTNTMLTEFIEKYETDIETFTTSMRQEFQDFIDVIELRFATIKTEIIADLDIETIQANITSLQADLTALENKVNNDIATQLSALETKVNEEISSQLSALETKVNEEMETQLSALDTSLKAYTDSAVETLRNEIISDLEGEY